MLCGEVLAESRRLGFAALLEAFGADLLSDTCWCMLGEVVPPPRAVKGTALITNSAKYAHYAPGLVRRQVRFGSLQSCVEAACTRRVGGLPPWLGVRRFATGHKALSHVARRLRVL